MGKTALIFPGQGAQYVGMAKDFYDNFSESKNAFDTASDIIGIDMKKLCFEDNDKINLTEYTQVALVTACTAILRPFISNCEFDVCAGLSLGEYMALVANKAVSFEDAIKLTRKRGIYMQEAVPVGVGGMAAVIGINQEVIEEICSKYSENLTVANFNTPQQFVISGKNESLEKVTEELKQAGAKRIVPLKVSGPFHSPLLIDAGEKLKAELDSIEINKPEVPYVSNYTGEYVYEKDLIKEYLAKQVYSSVRWTQSVQNMIDNGVTDFIEVGPGKTLSALVKKIDRNVNVKNIEKITDL